MINHMIERKRSNLKEIVFKIDTTFNTQLPEEKKCYENSVMHSLIF
jgi:hypothetical protein